MHYGVGRWVQILDTGLLPGKLIQQLNGQTQRLLGQQSLAGRSNLAASLQASPNGCDSIPCSLLNPVDLSPNASLSCYGRINLVQSFQATHPHHCTAEDMTAIFGLYTLSPRNRQSHNSVCGPRPVCIALTLSEMACISSAAYTGLHVDIDRIRADNEANKSALRKSGLIIWEGRELWPYI